VDGIASKLTRRTFLQSVGTGAVGAGLVTICVNLIARQSQAVPAFALRPPGALPEEKFLGACARCGQCVQACPYKALMLGRLGDPLPVGTPYFEARSVPCEMCDDIPCVAACPTGALDPELTRIDDARMGLAALLDHENCLNHLGLRCDVCYRVCPLIGKAITLEARHNRRSGKHTLFLPTVHSDTCTGCGKCERSCVLEAAAIKVFPLHLAKGQLGAHYRLGWKEKQKAGGPLVPDLIQLPVRRPEDLR